MDAHRAVKTEAAAIADPAEKKAKMMQSVVYANNEKVHLTHISSPPPPTCLISGILIIWVVAAGF